MAFEDTLSIFSKNSPNLKKKKIFIFNQKLLIWISKMNFETLEKSFAGW